MVRVNYLSTSTFKNKYCPKPSTDFPRTDPLVAKGMLEARTKNQGHNAQIFSKKKGPLAKALQIFCEISGFLKKKMFFEAGHFQELVGFEAKAKDLAVSRTCRLRG